LKEKLRGFRPFLQFAGHKNPRRSTLLSGCSFGYNRLLYDHTHTHAGRTGHLAFYAKCLLGEGAVGIRHYSCTSMRSLALPWATNSALAASSSHSTPWLGFKIKFTFLMCKKSLAPRPRNCVSFMFANFNGHDSWYFC